MKSTKACYTVYARHISVDRITWRTLTTVVFQDQSKLGNVYQAKRYSGSSPEIVQIAKQCGSTQSAILVGWAVFSKNRDRSF